VRTSNPTNNNMIPGELGKNLPLPPLKHFSERSREKEGR
jgi:hypothetical protein